MTEASALDVLIVISKSTPGMTEDDATKILRKTGVTPDRARILAREFLTNLEPEVLA